MRVIASGRKTSRTTQLIELAAQYEKEGKPVYIVCHTHQEAHRIAQKAKELNLFIGFPIIYDEFLRHEYFAPNIHGFLIDNAEKLLQQLSKVPILALTILKEPDV